MSYSPESTTAPMAMLRASRSSPESSRTANPKFSSEKVTIRVPSRDRTGASPIAYMTSPLFRAVMTDGKSSKALIVAIPRFSLAYRSEVVPDWTPMVVPAALRSATAVMDAAPDPPITPWLLV